MIICMTISVGDIAFIASLRQLEIGYLLNNVAVKVNFLLRSVFRNGENGYLIIHLADIL